MIVRWTPPAAKDLRHICDNTERHFGVDQARRAGLLIYEAAESLQQMPLLGRVGRKPGTRELVIAGLPFVMIYRVKSEAVDVLRVLHGAQQWP